MPNNSFKPTPLRGARTVRPGAGGVAATAGGGSQKEGSRPKKARVSTADPDARVMKMPDEWRITLPLTGEIDKNLQPMDGLARLGGKLLVHHAPAGSGPVQATWRNQVVVTQRIAVVDASFRVEKQIRDRREAGMRMRRKSGRADPGRVDAEEGSIGSAASPPRRA